MPRTPALKHLWPLLVVLVSAQAVAVVCRRGGIEGFDNSRIERVKEWLGEYTTDPAKMKVYLSKGVQEDSDTKQSAPVYFIQSNFRSEIPDKPGTYFDDPTKIVDDVETLQKKDMVGLIGNLMFATDAQGRPPSDWHQRAARALANADIAVDADIIGSDGRPPFDVSQAGTLRIANDSGVVSAGLVEPLRLGTPPPSLVERIYDCCFSGRPAGRGAAIRRNLEQHNIRQSDIALLQFQPDSKTSEVISQSAVLRDARGRASVNERSSWNAKLRAALAASRDKTLIMLTHVHDGKVVVEAADGRSEFTITLEDVHKLASESRVNLVLIGCDTAASAQSFNTVAGVVGEYRIDHAASRLDYAIRNSKNALELLSNLSAKGLTIVTQEGSWSASGHGATYYGKVRGALKRAFRVWFLGKKNG